MAPGPEKDVELWEERSQNRGYWGYREGEEGEDGEEGYGISMEYGGGG